MPARTDRLVLVGQTGSGKTTLARYLLTGRKWKVVLDYKGRMSWPEYTVVTTLKALVRSKAQALLYRPSYAESVNIETCARLWEFLYKRGNTTIYNDETAATTKGDTYPYYFGACLMRGRECGVELWSGTQRPSRIPMIVLSESEHVYAFNLRLPQDRERIESITGIDRDLLFSLPKQHFFYSQQDADAVGPLKLEIPK